MEQPAPDAHSLPALMVASIEGEFWEYQPRDTIPEWPDAASCIKLKYKDGECSCGAPCWFKRRVLLMY